MADLHTPEFLPRFTCLGSACEDMCCLGWSMQLDDATFGKYQAQAPELLDAVMEEEGAGRVMRRDPTTTACVKLEEGWCGIQKKHGDGMLGDACHFYPRVTRALGAQTMMTASLSCPEVARLSLLGEQDISLGQRLSLERLPHSLRDYLPQGLHSEEALQTHEVFLKAAQDGSATPEQIMHRLASVARSLERVPVANWPQAAGVFLSLADGRIPNAVPVAENPFNLLHCLCGLIVASRKKPSSRMQEVIAHMESALASRLDWQAVTITTTPPSLLKYQEALKNWNEHHAVLHAPWLRRWIAMQLSVALFPFAGSGKILEERVTVLGVRFALLKLALLSYASGDDSQPPQERFIFVAQTLSRFMDHLGDPAFLLSVCAETGWGREEKMRALIEG